ncbi:hypothetical protein [Listeria booriae]|uniref:hypothetical protein n=1 Tax=Listeria booriae TaxID=1552123 RepID=UPI0016282D4C|nr:hypothetical protein [Listeria booriae]MBC2163457.1 hypothetical protein [Listeria booriae]
MRNKYHGECYRCGKDCQPGAGHFERYKSGWRTQHADCAIKYRGTSVHYETNPLNDDEKFHLLDKDGKILKEYKNAEEVLQDLNGKNKSEFFIDIKMHHMLTVPEFVNRYQTNWRR